MILNRCIHFALAGALTVIATLALAPATAQAGIYKMYSCNVPGVNVANPTSGPWRSFSVSTSGTQVFDTCASSPTGAMITGNNGNTMPPFGNNGWELPAGELNPEIGIVRVKSFVKVQNETTPPSCAAPPAGCTAYVYVHPIENFDPAVTNHVTGGGDDRADGFTSPTTDPPAPRFRLGLLCANGAAGEPCRLVHNQTLFVQGAIADLTENRPPNATIDGGGLAAAGEKSGAQGLSYTATDGESGIERVEALVGDLVVATDNFARNLTLPVAQQTGACTYTGLAACPPLVTRTLTADMTKVPGGTYTVYLRATDAAGNARIVPGPEITVTGGPGAPNGTPASRAAKISVRFTATTARTRRLRFTSSPAMQGTLVNEAGAPISGAAVAVLVRNANPGAKRRQVAVVQTQPGGTFTYTLAGGPSRTVTFAYTAFGGDARPASRASLKTRVRASLSARASARAVRAGRPFTITGRLRHLPRAGVKIIIQARGRRGWETILHPVRTRSGGRYVWRTRFGRETAGRTYMLRARVDSETYPFTPGSSGPLRVTVLR